MKAAFGTLVFFFALLVQPEALNGENLRVNFYSETCPRAEEIVHQTVSGAVFLNPALTGGFLRLYFHDCFVRGCDASILLDAMPTGEPVEKASGANGDTLRGLETIDEAKKRLENECPETVSCADILAFAARDAATLAGFPWYDIPSGRRDGTVSHADDPGIFLPSPSSNLEQLTKAFADKGFNQEELVTLSGAHSIGISHCKFFSFRLYNFNTTHAQDPDLDPAYARELKAACPEPGTMASELLGNPTVNFDSLTEMKLDGRYYSGLRMGRGLLGSDQALMTSEETRKVVRMMAFQPTQWAEKFAAAMVKIGNLDVLTGDQGEVRTMCRFVNTPLTEDLPGVIEFDPFQLSLGGRL